MDKKEIIEQLVEKINMYNEHYYTFDNPLISDKEWDKLYAQLEELERETGYVLKNSPTKKVGGDVLKGFKKVRHAEKLYSLDKCNSFDRLITWITDIKSKFDVKDFSLEYKFDGLRIVLEYVNGELISAVTRGNGIVGEDVTKQIKTIKSLPKKLEFKGHLVVTGEVVMRKSVFKKYNETAAIPLKNERNAAAGAVRNIDEKITASRNLDAVIYDIISVDDEIISQKQAYDFLRNAGFLTWDYFKILSDANQVEQVIAQAESNKNKLDILIDGMVLKVNDFQKRESIGYTNKFPKWAVAYKFEADEVATILKDVVWQVGRTGKITPVAIVEEVFLAGANVTRATLNNYNDIVRKGVLINSSVFIRRSNEVIPEILGVAQHFTGSMQIEKPVVCPSCGALLKEIGANLFCDNVYNCTPQISQKIVHFCSRNAMNIEGVNEKTVEAFIENFNIKSVADLYDITYDQLLTLEGYKHKKAQNFIDNVKKSKQCEFSNLIYALSIEGVGDKTAQDIAKNFDSFDALANASLENLIAIDNIGEVVAASIINFFENDENKKIINSLFEKQITIKYSNKITNHEFFTGKTVVLTGSLKNYTRQDASKLLQNFGANVASSVSAKTDYVIFGDEAGSKLEKAVTLGVKTLSEEEFLELI